jgi:hypothetical protein
VNESYPVAPLIRYLVLYCGSEHADSEYTAERGAEILGVSYRTWLRATKKGTLTLKQADLYSCRLGLNIMLLWPEIYDPNHGECAYL